VKKTSQQTHWLIDSGLLVALLLSFYVDMTGVNLHQWLGIGVTVLALIHLLLHWDWVVSVAKRFFGRTSRRSRIYMLFDLLIMLGAVIVFETGLVISTWFNLDLYNYVAWLDIHIYSSVITLGLTVLKLGLHWRWIINTTRKIFGQSETLRIPQPFQPVIVPVSIDQKQVDRRHFLIMLGAISVASAAAASNVFSKIKEVQSAALPLTTAIPVETTPEPTVTLANQEAQATQESQTRTEAETAATAAPEIFVSAPVQGCTVRCPRGCSYPGRCRRYTDANGNNKCDLGECL
jgi:hypothetical protein